MEIWSTRRRCWWPRLSGSGLQRARAGINGGGGGPELGEDLAQAGGRWQGGSNSQHLPCLMKH